LRLLSHIVSSINLKGSTSWSYTRFMSSLGLKESKIICTLLK
jgi:hypothetical protein